MKMLLIATVALAGLATAAEARHRSYDLRDVQPYPGVLPLECPSGTGYFNEACPVSVHGHGMIERHHIAMGAGSQTSSAFAGMSAIETSHNGM